MHTGTHDITPPGRHERSLSYATERIGPYTVPGGEGELSPALVRELRFTNAALQKAVADVSERDQIILAMRSTVSTQASELDALRERCALAEERLCAEVERRPTAPRVYMPTPPPRLPLPSASNYSSGSLYEQARESLQRSESPHLRATSPTGAISPMARPLPLTLTTSSNLYDQARALLAFRSPLSR